MLPRSNKINRFPQSFLLTGYGHIKNQMKKILLSFSRNTITYHHTPHHKYRPYDKSMDLMYRKTNGRYKNQPNGYKLFSTEHLIQLSKLRSYQISLSPFPLKIKNTKQSYTHKLTQAQHIHYVFLINDCHKKKYSESIKHDS